MRVLSNLRASGGLTIPVLAGATPVSGEVAVYVKSDGLVYKKNSLGEETLLTARENLDPLVGAVFDYAGSNIPAGYLLADGSLVSRSAYSELFARIGTTYGAGDGTTTFALPNLKGRMVVGRDTAQTEFDTLGETGGNKILNLSHSHPKAYTGGNISTVANTAGSYVVSNTNDVGLSANGGTPLGNVNTMNPYIVLNKIIKVSSTVGGMIPNQVIEMGATHTAISAWSKAPITVTNSTPGSAMTYTANGVTINQSGWYRITGFVGWDAASSRRIARVVPAASSATAASGAAFIACEDNQGGGGYPGGSFGCTRYITSGTHIRLEVYQDSGATVSNTISQMTVEAMQNSTLDVYETEWTDVTFLGSWQNFETGTLARKVQVKRVGKSVKYRGIMKSGAVGNGTAAFSVPAQFACELRTYSSQYWPIVANSAFGAIQCGSVSGQFEVAVGSNVWVDVSGVHYFVP